MSPEPEAKTPAADIVEEVLRLDALATADVWRVSELSELIFNGNLGPVGFVYGPAFAERSELGRRAITNTILIAFYRTAAPELARLLQASSLRERALKEALEAVEWEGNMETCLVCERLRDEGHRDNCKLAAALALKVSHDH